MATTVIVNKCKHNHAKSVLRPTQSRSLPSSTSHCTGRVMSTYSTSGWRSPASCQGTRLPWSCPLVSASRPYSTRCNTRPFRPYSAARTLLYLSSMRATLASASALSLASLSLSTSLFFLLASSLLLAW